MHFQHKDPKNTCNKKMKIKLKVNPPVHQIKQISGKHQYAQILAFISLILVLVIPSHKQVNYALDPTPYCSSHPDKESGELFVPFGHSTASKRRNKPSINHAINPLHPKTRREDSRLS